MVSADFFVVPTITFRLLFVFATLSHDSRRPIHFALTTNPNAEWTAQQLVGAFRGTVRLGICFEIATSFTGLSSVMPLVHRGFGRF